MAKEDSFAKKLAKKGLLGIMLEQNRKEKEEEEKKNPNMQDTVRQGVKGFHDLNKRLEEVRKEQEERRKSRK